MGSKTWLTKIIDLHGFPNIHSWWQQGWLCCVLMCSHCSVTISRLMVCCEFSWPVRQGQTCVWEFLPGVMKCPGCQAMRESGGTNRGAVHLSKWAEGMGLKQHWFPVYQVHCRLTQLPCEHHWTENPGNLTWMWNLAGLNSGNTMLKIVVL